MAITFCTVSIHLKSLPPQCCVNTVSYSFSTHSIPCYHSNVAITFITVSIHLKSVLPHFCVNKVSYSFYTHISPCYHSAVAIMFLTVSIHFKSLLPHCCGNNVYYSVYTWEFLLPELCGNNVPYQYIHDTNPCYHSAVSKRFLSAHCHLKVLFYSLSHCHSLSTP